MGITAAEWRPIEGWPEYELSSDGEIRSRQRVVTQANGNTYSVRAKVLRGECGRARVTLSRPGARRKASISTLLAEVFGGQ